MMYYTDRKEALKEVLSQPEGSFIIFADGDNDSIMQVGSDGIWRFHRDIDRDIDYEAEDVARWITVSEDYTPSEWAFS